MSIIGESIALLTALKLEGILEIIIQEADEESYGVLMLFARKELYKWYLEECDTAFKDPNQRIVKEFG